MKDECAKLESRKGQLHTLRRWRSDLKCSRCSCSDSNSVAQVLQVHLNPGVSESCCCCVVDGTAGCPEGSGRSAAMGAKEGCARRRTDESKKSEGRSKSERGGAGDLFSGAAGADAMLELGRGGRGGCVDPMISCRAACVLRALCDDSIRVGKRIRFSMDSAMPIGASWAIAQQ
jgi:hypothetical protein